MQPVGYLQAWLRIWTWDNREQIQQVARAELEPGTTWPCCLLDPNSITKILSPLLLQLICKLSPVDERPFLLLSSWTAFFFLDPLFVEDSWDMSSSSDSSASIVTLMAPRRPFLEAAVVVGVSSSSPLQVAGTCFVVSEVESITAFFSWLCSLPFVLGVCDFPLLELDLSDVFAQRNNQIIT